MNGAIGEISGIAVFEDKNQPEGTYTKLDKNGLPTRDVSKTVKIIVHDFETFKIALENNQNK